MDTAEVDALVSVALDVGNVDADALDCCVERVQHCRHRRQVQREMEWETCRHVASTVAWSYPEELVDNSIDSIATDCHHCSRVEALWREKALLLLTLVFWVPLQADHATAGVSGEDVRLLPVALLAALPPLLPAPLPAAVDVAAAVADVAVCVAATVDASDVAAVVAALLPPWPALLHATSDCDSRWDCSNNWRAQTAEEGSDWVDW